MALLRRSARRPCGDIQCLAGALQRIALWRVNQLGSAASPIVAGQRITDNGEGFRLPMSPYTGMGLKIMQYRAGIIGAKFEIAPNVPRGTVVRVTGEHNH